MANRIQLRRDTTSNWNSVDPVLADGEPGYDIVTNELRIGNGSDAWSELSANTISGGGGGASTGNVTFSDKNVIGTSSLRLQPNVALSTSYIDIYLTTGPDTHIDTYSANLILGKDSSANVRLATDGNVQIQAQDGGSASTWTFDPDGTLTLPNGLNGANSQIYTTNGGYQTVFETFNDGTGRGSGQKLTLDYDDAAVKIQSQAGTEWKFDQAGNLQLPAGGVIVNSDSSVYGMINTSSSVSTLTVSDASGDYQYSSLAYNYTVNGNGGGFTIAYSAPLAFGNVDISVGNVVTTGTANIGGNLIVGGNLLLSSGGEIYSESGTGNVVIETNDGNNVRSWTFTGNGAIQNPVLTIATLPSASPAGQRAFVSDGADTAVTWSVAVSATGSNTYPVWSDGIVWRYG